MGGTLTLVVGESRQLSTPLGDGSAADWSRSHARCWVLRDRASRVTLRHDSSDRDLVD